MAPLRVLAALGAMAARAAAFTPAATNSPALRRRSSAVMRMGFFDDLKVGLVKSLAGDYDAAAVVAETDEMLAAGPVVMLSFSTCPFCVKAKATLDAAGAKYTVFELDTMESGKGIRAELGERTGGRTSVPAIWIGGEYAGGCNDGGLGGVMSLQERGELGPLLKAAGAL